MSTRMLYGAIGAWLAVVAAAAGLGPLTGTPITAGTGTLLLVVGLVPPVIMVALCGGAPRQTVAELLHATDREV
jgi:hypothetical protein